ncbi:hypothetical protein BdWA1_000558 [Babesia duncani]|uniref:Uncharacterized protein n=1 Tax=Babesia duncani TaxID=323732 RepID=A0AAD9PN11_9APIC|nr:hypothetical protein BdWA1_003818 [Babesia duncani]KAK2197556.1 hypothetical protein BdWA1_000558 [Babesia duncani]
MLRDKTFLQFSRLHSFAVDSVPLHDLVILYFILDNFNKTHLKNIKEINVISHDLFDVYFTNGGEVLGVHAGSACEGIAHENNSTCNNIASFRFSTLLADDNLILTSDQKQYVASIYQSQDANNNLPLVHLFLGKEDNDYYLVFCECCASTFAHLMRSITTNWKVPIANQRESGGLSKVEYGDKYLHLDDYGNFNHKECDSELDQCSDEIVHLLIVAGFLQLFISPSLTGVVVMLFDMMDARVNLPIEKYFKVAGMLILNYPKEGILWNLRHKLFILCWNKNRRIASIFHPYKQARPQPLSCSSINRLMDFLKEDKFIKGECKLLSQVLKKHVTNNVVSLHLLNLYKYVHLDVLQYFKRVSKIYQRKLHNVRNITKGWHNRATCGYRVRLVVSKAMLEYFIKALLKLASLGGHPGVLQMIQNVLNDAERIMDCNVATMRVIKFCNANIANDRHNTWVENKTQILLWKISKFNNRNINSGLRWLIKEHLETWKSFINIQSITRIWGNYKRPDLKLVQYESGKSEAELFKQEILKYTQSAYKISAHHIKRFSNPELDRILVACRQLLKILYALFVKMCELQTRHKVSIWGLEPLILIIKSLVVKKPTGVFKIKSRPLFAQLVSLMRSVMFTFC